MSIQADHAPRTSLAVTAVLFTGVSSAYKRYAALSFVEQTVPVALMALNVGLLSMQL